MPTSITALDVTEPYAALTVLKQSQLNSMVDSIEDYINAQLRLNLVQLAIDTMGDSYAFTDDGVASLATPLADLAGKLADNEIVTGAWTFSGAVAFSAAVTSTSTFTSSGQNRARAYRTTSNQSLSDATATAISLGAESYDVGAMHDNSTNPSRITIPTGGSGTYSFVGQITFDNNATGRREIAIYKNGSKVAENKNFTSDGTEDTAIQVFFLDSSSQGDYYELYGYQNRGGALDVIFGEFKTFFAAHKLW